MPLTYECPICYAVNSAKQLHCRCCGTIPAHYSATGKPYTYHWQSLNPVVNIVAAIGVDRQERHRTCKRVLKTIPADYYSVVD